MIDLDKIGQGNAGPRRPPASVNSILTGLSDANDDVVKMVDEDPELRARYEHDMRAWAMDRRTTQDLLALMFEDQSLGLTREDEKYRYLDIARINSVPYRYLRMAGRTETPRIIKSYRRLRFIRFSEPASRKKFGKDVGYKLGWEDPHYKPTKQEEQERQFWELRVPRFFFPANAKEPSFSSFIGEAYEDWFDYDDITFSVRRDGLTKPVAMHLEDPIYWYPTIPKILKYPRIDDDLLPALATDGEVDIPEADYVLMKDEQRYAAVTKDYLYKAHFFTRSDYLMARRGYGVMEQAIRITTMLLNAMAANASNWTNDRIPPGILALTGGITNPLLMERIKKIIWANLSGAANHRKLPVIGLPEKGDAKFIPFHQSARDMEFHTFYTLLTTMEFALSGTNPNEAGMASFMDAMKGARLNDDNKDSIMAQSQDTGENMFIGHLEQNVVNHRNDKGDSIWYQLTGLQLRLELEGTAIENVASRVKIDTERLAVSASVNDILEENGKKKQHLEIGGVDIYDVVAVNSPTISKLISTKIGMEIQQQQQQQQMQQQAAMQAGQGAQQQQQQYSPADQELINKYGPPVGAGQGAGEEGEEGEEEEG